MIVVDASVAVKWFLKEHHSDHAVTLLTLDQKLVGPTLAIYEVVGAFVRALKRKSVDLDLATACRDRWLHTVRTNVLRLECDNRDIIRATEIGAALEHPLADCIYLAMAERLDAPLVTADAVFAEKAKPSFERIHFIDNVLEICPATPASS